MASREARQLPAGQRYTVDFLKRICKESNSGDGVHSEQHSANGWNKVARKRDNRFVTVLEEKHKLATRWFHWINFPILSAMIFSGLLIYWAYDPYRIGLGSVTLFHFFPDWFYKVTGIGEMLSLGMGLHFLFAWIFAINGVAYVIYTLVSGEWRELLPERKSFGEAIQVAMHDMGLKVPLPPQGRYNAAQRLSYSGIVVMGGLSLLTGLAIYKPAQLHWLTALAGGYEWARWEHFWLTMGYLGFFVIHIAQVVRAGWPNFRSMVCGYDLAEVPQAEVNHGD
jgi:thiosulfate reductase cytochrome b subunit